MEKEKEYKDYWSECGQIFFHYGTGYGITPELKTISLGKEEDIQKALNDGELSPDLAPLQRQVLTGIIEYRKEEGIGTTDIGTADMERAGNNRTSRHKPKATRPLTLRKGLPLRPSRTKDTCLSRK